MCPSPSVVVVVVVVVVVDTLPPQIVTSSLWDNLSKFANVFIFNSFLI